MYVPSSELGLSQPLSRQRVCPSPQNRVSMQVFYQKVVHVHRVNQLLRHTYTVVLLPPHGPLHPIRLVDSISWSKHRTPDTCHFLRIFLRNNHSNIPPPPLLQLPSADTNPKNRIMISWDPFSDNLPSPMGNPHSWSLFITQGWLHFLCRRCRFATLSFSVCFALLVISVATPPSPLPSLPLIHPPLLLFKYYRL